jgi:hypothetical protein
MCFIAVMSGLRDADVDGAADDDDEDTVDWRLSLSITGGKGCSGSEGAAAPTGVVAVQRRDTTTTW